MHSQILRPLFGLGPIPRVIVLLCWLCSTTVRAENGSAAWLRYAPLPTSTATFQSDRFPTTILILSNSLVLNTACQELLRGVQSLTGRTLRLKSSLHSENTLVLGTVDQLQPLFPALPQSPALVDDGFWLKSVKTGGRTHLIITAQNERGVLYGAFALLRQMALKERLANLNLVQNPYAPVRLINQWDNLDGSIERGYAGPSIFFESNTIASDLRNSSPPGTQSSSPARSLQILNQASPSSSRASDYGRLLASIGINGCAINNVNADTRILDSDFLPQLARIADALRPWGVRILVSVDFSSPQKLGGLKTFDPLDPQVVQWWQVKIDEIYRTIPDFGGFVLKADSEGRLGPSAYGRTHADAANVLARPLKAHHGLLFYRGFVYDHHMDWQNLKNDRALAAYQNFHKLDGQFEENALVQIKHGPIDFQVREPVSPLLGGLEHTSEALELQITQEYTGQQRHLCFLAPMWKEVLDFDLQAKGSGTPVKALAAGKTFHRPTGGLVGVANVGQATNWLGHPLAMANLYAFGRLAWNPDLSSRQIAEEWTRLTFSQDRQAVDTMVAMLLQSWPMYENYTGPLGAGTLTDIIHIHYGPAPESSEYNGWGQWHRANATGVGMDRTFGTGTGFIAQYSPALALKYESLESCPDELLLFFHHVPYDYKLHSGKTVIQHIYDSHYLGAQQAEQLVREWKALSGKIDEERYNEVLRRLEYQAGHAQVWRDSICSWFLKKSGIPDARCRAGQFPDRIEAEAMDLNGYEVFEVTPWEAASGGKAVRCNAPDGHGSLSFQYSGRPGWFNLRVQYFDQNTGVSHFAVFVAGQRVDEWVADDSLPTKEPDAHSSTRHTTRGLALRPGDTIRIEGVAQGREKACVDYVEIVPF